MAKSRRKETGGPYVCGAFFCERVLIEQDGVSTFIRVVDVLTVDQPEGPEAAPDGVPVVPASVLMAAVMLKSGDAKGERRLRIDAITPSGERRPGRTNVVTFLGGEQGVNIRGPVPVPVGEEGLFWYEVLVDGEPLTRMPLRVVHSRPTAESPPPPAGGPPGTGGGRRKRSRRT